MNSKLINFRGVTHIYYSYKGTVLRISTGIPFEQSKKTENIKIIAVQKKKVDDVISSYHISKGDKPLASEVKKLLSSEEPLNTTLLLSVIQRFIERKKTSENFKPQSIHIYNSLYRSLEGYEELHKVKIHLSDINDNFIKKYRYYLFKHRDNNRSTSNKRIKTLKELFKWCYDNDIYKFDVNILTIKPLKKSKPEDVIDKSLISLTVDEIKDISILELTGYEEQVRDIFLVLCLSGMRISDAYNIHKRYISEDGKRLEMVSIKTGETFKVPLNGILKVTLEKYGYSLPSIPNPTFNRIIKRICLKIPSLQKEVDVEREGYNSISRKVIPKYMLVTSHTGRRTFITNGILKGVDINVLQSITGHKKQDQLLAYRDSLKKFVEDDEEKLNFLK